jgi:hypothetical protein
LDLEEAGDEEAAGVEREVFEEEEDGAGLALEARLVLRRLVFVPIAGQSFLIGEVYPVFKQDALTAEHL